jgi:hypothetical protein
MPTQRRARLPAPEQLRANSVEGATDGDITAGLPQVLEEGKTHTIAPLQLDCRP